MTFTPSITVTLHESEFTATDGRLIKVTISERGHKGVQDATITIDNDGTLWVDDFPPYAEAHVEVEGDDVFEGFIDSLQVTGGPRGQLIIQCAGHSKELAMSDVRPIIYDSEAASDERDGAGVIATVSGGKIILPQDAKHIPIHQLYNIHDAAGAPINVLNIDRPNGIIFVDPIHNGLAATVNYSVFKEKYSNERADAILLDLFNRHAIAHISSASIATIATALTFEPSLGSDLFKEWGRVREQLGSAYDFFVDANHVANFVARSGTSVETLDIESATGKTMQDDGYSVDSLAYANVITTRASEGITNTITQTEGAFEHFIEGLTPTGQIVDAVAQGFKALDESLQSFTILAKRETEDDIIEWAIEYNGARGAIFDPLTASQVPVTPDSTNITYVEASDHVRVMTNGTGTAYFSNSWNPDIAQTTSDATSTITGNIYQTIAVSDLARTTIGGIAFKSPSASGTVRFDIYSGTGGTSGTLLGSSETVDLSVADREVTTDWFAVYFATPVDVSAQTNISIVAVATAGAPSWDRNTAGGYSGGQASAGAGEDFAFQIYSQRPIQDLFASVAKWARTLVDANKEPTFFVARDYVIGNPNAANWVQVINNAPRLVTGGTSADMLGFKIVFNSASTTTDPLVEEIHVSCAYTDPSESLDEPSGIVAGDHSGTIGASDLPFFNEETGSFTGEVSFGDSRVERGGNYWLSLTDGNQDAAGVSFFTAHYEDGSDGLFTETWDDSTNIASETNLLVQNGQATIDPFTKTALMQSTDIITIGSTITAARVSPSDTGAAARIISLLSRNHRNYYYPGRSTTPTGPALYTGELAIWQFDAGDVTTISSTQSVIVDASGNGFNLTVPINSVASSPTGKYGTGMVDAAVGADTGALGLSKWLSGDYGIAFWFKPDSLADDRYIIAIDDQSGRVQLHIRTMSTGKIKLFHTYNVGASDESFQSTGTLSVGVWTHVTITKESATKEYKIYLDGALDSTHTYTNEPDTPRSTSQDFLVWGKNTVASGMSDGTLDEVRVWNTIPQTWQIGLVKDYPYDAGQSTKFTFPTEADGTDDDTTGDSADASKDDVRVRQYYLPSPFYGEDILARLPFNFSNIHSTSVSSSSEVDLSSYAHQHDPQMGEGTTGPTIITGGLRGERADFDGSNDGFGLLHSDAFLELQDEWSLLWNMTQDGTGSTGTLFHKRGVFRVQAVATSSTLSNLDVQIQPIGGVAVRSHVFTGLSIGTGTHRVGLSYDNRTLTVFVDGAQAGTKDFGSAIRTASTTNSFTVGCIDGTGLSGGRSAFFDGKLDEIVLIRGTITAAQAAAIHADPSIGLRAPIQTQYVAAAYGPNPQRAYADGKYLVTRDDADTWDDFLDDAISSPFGSLAFTITFGKGGLTCTRRDQAEIDRLGIEVRKTIEVPASDMATLCAYAEGYLDLLKDGLEKGHVTVNGRADIGVGDIITINHPFKGQVDKEYVVAGVEHVIDPAVGWGTTYQLGEEERSDIAILKGIEVGL